MNEKAKIKHALHYGWLNKFYDSITAITCREKYFKMKMLDLSADILESPVLDVACGTGTFMNMLRNRRPNLKIIGIDADPGILSIAESKTKHNNKIQFVEAYSHETNFENESIGIAFSSLFYHHLTTEIKLSTTHEIFRILKKGSHYIIADWSKPNNLFTAFGFLLLRLFDGFDTTRDNLENKIPDILKSCGFTDIIECASINTFFGTVRIWKGTK